MKYLPSKLDLLLPILLAAMTIAAFLPAIHCEFNLTDDPIIADQPHVRTGITAANLRWAFTTPELGYPIPITLVSFMADADVFGINAPAFHAENIAWHVLDVLLLYWLLRRMTGAIWRSALVAALFAVHPLRVESVVWVTERKDVLAAFFGLLAMHAYLTYTQRPGLRRYMVVALLIILSLFAKPMLVTLPALLVVLDFWPLRPVGPSFTFLRSFTEKIPLALISLAATIAGIWGQAHRDAPPNHLPFTSLAANAIVSYVRYIAKIIWPRPLALCYPMIAHWPTWQVAGTVLILTAITIFVILQRNTRPWLAVGWAWYAVILVPAAGFYSLGDFSIADRYTYFPMIGLLILVIWSLPLWLGKGAARIPTGLAVTALLTSLILATRAQAMVWQNNLTLFGHTLDTVGRSVLVCNDMAIALTKAHRNAEAIPYYNQTLTMDPDNRVASANLAALLDQAGNHAAAIPHYRKALEFTPDDIRICQNLAADLMSVNQPQAAIPLLSHALALRPDSAELRTNYAAALARSGDRPAAETQYKLAILADPHSADAYDELGALCLSEGRLPYAIFCFQEALRVNANLARAHNNLGVALAQQGKPDEAAAEFQKALRINPNDGDAKRNLELAAQMKLGQ